MSATIDAAERETVIAHRGASHDAPENTRASIALAIEHGAKVIEFDVRQTGDEVLFLFHDEELNRLCGRNGIFEKLDSESAARLDVGSWFTKQEFTDETPPLLRDAITQCMDGGCVPLIEQKTGSPESYAAVLSDLDAVEHVIVQSFDWEFLRGLREILPQLQIGALGKKQLEYHKSDLLKLKPNWVGWKDCEIRKRDVKWFRNHQFHVAVWTVNDPQRARNLFGCGVDKIITDRWKYLSEALLE